MRQEAIRHGAIKTKCKKCEIKAMIKIIGSETLVKYHICLINKASVVDDVDWLSKQTEIR